MRQCAKSLPVIVLISLSTPATGQAVQVLSGEHDEFTRLAMSLPAGVDWSYEQRSDGYNVFLDSVTQISLSGIFDLIPRTRISDVEVLPENSGISLSLNCDCPVSIFAVNNEALAIDVFDVPTENTLAGVEEGPSFTELIGAVSGSGEASTATVFLAPSEFNLDTQRIEGLPVRQLQNSEEPSTPQASIEMQTNSVFNELRSGLAISASLSGIEFYDDAQVSGPLDDLTESESSQNINLRNLTGGVAHSRNNQELDHSEKNCPDPKVLEFLGDVNLERLREDLPLRKKEIVDERGAESKEGARALVYHYLGLTFGREALKTLDQANFSTETQQILRELAGIIDQDRTVETIRLRELEGCGPAFALWSLLGNPNLDATQLAMPEGIRDAFFNLPQHIRLHIGEDLSRRLMDAGHKDVSLAVRENLENLIYVVQEQRGHEGGSAPKPSISEVGSDSVVEEVLFQAQREMEESRSVSIPTSAAASALYREYSSSPYAERILDIISIKRIQEGSLEAENLARLNDHDKSAEAWGIAVRDAASNEVSRLDLGTVLDLFDEGGPSAALEFVNNGDQLSIAERMLAAGFRREAYALTSSRGDSLSKEWLHVRARSTYDEESVRRSINELEIYDDPASLQIRGDLLVRLGNLAAAADAYSAAGRQNRASNAAWLSEDDVALSAHGTLAQRELSGTLEGMEPQRDASLSELPREIANGNGVSGASNGIATRESDGSSPALPESVSTLVDGVGLDPSAVPDNAFDGLQSEPVGTQARQLSEARRLLSDAIDTRRRMELYSSIGSIE